MIEDKANEVSKSPITFKISYYMLEKVEEMIKNGEYPNKAELIREAIQDLINYENTIETIKV